ncbi:A-kinase anchor protein 9 isoform X3 [Eupeodes corollae]|uniref:A-kinase anchor protein 9 isoform X3 n=1 Tax=Eupeodes corollae TaxID=290404 RepID=UPI0024919BCA|nr:A-kinase anchor protein 9 isoform X3 [Eupeodes corollae]
MREFHFTSLIRRRGRYKSISLGSSPERDVETPPPQARNVEIIPNLTFVTSQPDINQNARAGPSTSRSRSEQSKPPTKSLNQTVVIEMEAIKSLTTTTTSEDISIEEEIEEAISAGSSLGLSEARGGVGDDIATKRRNLFGLEGSEDEKSLQKKKKISSSSLKDDDLKLNKIKKDEVKDRSLTKVDATEERDRRKPKDEDHDDEEDDGLFKIDDDQLSGGKIAQHFVLELSRKSEHIDKTFDKEEIDDRSLTNQSTANDVSEIIDEISLEIQQTSSLPIKPSPLEVEPEHRKYKSLEISINSTTQDESLESMHSEKDYSVGEEMVHVNQSLNMTFEDRNLSSLNPSLANNESLIDRLLAGTPLPEQNSSSSSSREDDFEEMKQKILALTQSSQMAKPLPLDQQVATEIVVKQMERVPSEFSKDVLEDITEESEKQYSLSPSDDNLRRQPSPSGADAPHGSPVNSLHGDLTLTERQESSLKIDDESIVSLKMIQMLEEKVSELKNIVDAKDACLASLTMQLDSAQRRESTSNAEQLPSGRESSSLMTTSTEYRTLQEEFGCATMDFYAELTKRDELISKLNDSLQQSLQFRENLQTESEKLTTEVQLLQKQLSEALENSRRPVGWPRDQESNGGQRISEISIDLVSESDDDFERHYLTDNEDKTSRHSRNSRERQASVPRTFEAFDFGESEVQPISKQIEQFKKYLTPNEVRLFFMVQKKFDDFLSQELEKFRMKYDGEVKILTDQMTSEKVERDAEINRLRQLLTSVKNGSTELMQLRHEMDAVHAKEMEDLRQYFEKKCADLEKQYSDEVFSQKSQRHDCSSSEASDQEMMPEEIATRSKESSPRKKTKAELLSSPSHRQLTPNLLEMATSGGGDSVAVDANANDVKTNIDELKTFYQAKINEINKSHEDTIRKLNEKLKHYESKFPSEDDFMEAKPNTPPKSPIVPNKSPPTSLIIIDQDELNNEESQVIQKIIGEYDRRLQEQVTLAREDIVRELENQIQALLSETTTDDHNWPPELILLREKFTAKSQLEIAQLQIKHEEEMSRLKTEFEKQYNRKVKRNSAFDLSRDFDQIVSERDGLRELSKTLRLILAELMRSVNNCEDDLNATLLDEVQRIMANRTIDGGGDDHDLNNSQLNNCSMLSKRVRFAPDVSGLLDVVDDPHLISYVSSKSVGISNSADLVDDFDLNECLERLKSEAVFLLELSEEIQKKNERKASESSGAEKVDSCEEDGMKNYSFVRASSFNENIWQSKKATSQQLLLSLPPDLNRVHALNESLDDFSSSIAASELNFQFHEFKNRLVKAENERSRMQHELELAIQRNKELSAQVIQLRDQLQNMDLREDYQGYGLGLIKSPQRIEDEKPTTSFIQLQEKARHILSSPTQQSNNATSTLLQMIEDFCREGDKVVENGKRDRDDLQSQIDTADKQLKATRQFLEDQAAERELERDEFLREIEKLKTLIRDKEKERNSFENASKEKYKNIFRNTVDNLEQQIKDLTHKLTECSTKKDKFEVELKASIDKIFVLREIISELETQVETKALNEHCLGEKIQELETYIGSQNRSNDTLQKEVQSLQKEIDQGYQEKIRQLEEKLQNTRPSLEQGVFMDQIVEQLRDIESTLDQKTKNLESLHHSSSSVSCNSNPIEDVSVQGKPLAMASALVSPPQGSPVHPSPRAQSLPIEGLQRVLEKLSKHTRMEEAAVKRIRDLEMQVSNIRSNCLELQHERDSLQEKMSEQMQRISALQSRLEEQRHRAEELQRQGSSDLNIRIHDLQNEVLNLKETLGTRDKQVANLKNHLEKSKAAIDRLEAELAVGSHSDRSLVERLEGELKMKNAEIQQLKEKIKSQMINKLALPDLMETMLADKNDEIDHLREQLEKKEKELQGVLELNLSEASNKTKNEGGAKVSARTLSDIVSISEYDEPDVIRRAVVDVDTPLMLPEGMRQGELTIDASKEAIANLTEKRTGDLAVFNSLHPARTFEHPHYFQDPSLLANKTGSTITQAIIPRHINFSEFGDDSKIKESTPKVTENEGKTLAVQLKAAQLEVEELRAKNNQMESEKVSEIDRLSKELVEAINQLQELKQSRLKLESEIAELKKSLQRRDHDFKTLEEDFTEVQLRLGAAQDDLEKKTKNEQNLQSEITAKSSQIDELQRETKDKSELLTKHEKNLANYQQNEEKHLLRLAELEDKIQSLSENSKEAEKTAEELNSARAELAEKIILYEKSVLDIADYQKQLDLSKSNLKSKDSSIEELNEKLLASEKRITHLEELNSALEKEIEKLRTQTSESSKPFSLDEIAQQVEKELNYSAQLDSNILKAIESEEENNFDVHTKNDNEKLIERDLLNQLETLRAQFELERQHADEMRKELIEEKQHSQDIQEQDVAIIEAMRTRLEGALAKEEELHKLLDDERDKCERLMTQITVFQRSEARKSSALLKSPSDSPRKSPRVSDFESELADRLRSEIKLLSAQNERERERATDLQRNLERERSRFDTELNDRIEYSERLKKEMEKVARDKDMAEQEVEHLQERLTLQSQEIESLEARIATLQEAETRRANRRDRQRVENTQNAVELQELKAKILALESERDHLNQTVALLRYDIERGAQREAKLAEAVSNSNAEGSIPQQFMQKMKEINNLLAENTKENRQMTETVQFLVEERRSLQKKCEELESQLGNNTNVAELEERANHLLGRYLRVESHRKALVYQKRYLKISLQSYQDSEAQMIAQLHGGAHCLAQKKRRRFKTVALAIIAIQRMKFIGRLWFTGKRIVSKSVFTITQQKRTQPIAIASASTSPPCRDTPSSQQSPFSLTEMPLGRPLQAPGIIADAAQKFDWSRMKHKRSTKTATFD